MLGHVWNFRQLDTQGHVGYPTRFLPAEGTGV